MSEWLIIIFSSLGTLFALLAAIGLIRMPDTFLRISVNTKAATLGVGLLIGAAAIFFNDIAISTRVLAIIIFIFLTAPIGGHLLGRTGYFTGNKLCDQTHIDDLKDQYNKKTHKLSSEDQNKTISTEESNNQKD